MKKTPKATPEHITVANLKAKEPRRSVGRAKKYSPSPDPVARRISRTAVDKAKNVLKKEEESDNNLFTFFYQTSVYDCKIGSY